MSKINTLRIINLNYNNNSIRIGDEIFHMNGESTLFSLRNGGGKTVLVQMMTAPFVHKRYRDTKDRPFESFFTTNKPTFILVEWALDGDAGYVLTGMMVRKNQEVTEGGLSEELEICNFISEYRERCERDIFHLPVVEEADTGRKLKGWGACKRLLEDLKRENSDFFLYSMNQPAQSRMYFEKLKEYQINHREWEGIIKKVNVKESGLSELFADCRDEKGLVEKWFLDAVENKLNRDSNRVKEFQNMVMKYIRVYQENQTKITRLGVIRQFQELSEQLLGRCGRYRDVTAQRERYEQQISCFRAALRELGRKAGEDRQQILEQIEQMQRDLNRISYEKISYEIYQQEDEQEFHARDREQFILEKEQIEREAQELQREKNRLECARLFQEKLEALSECKMLEGRLQVSRQDEREKEPERRAVGGMLYWHYAGQKEKLEASLRQSRERLGELGQEEQQWRERQDAYQQELTDKSAQAGELRARIGAYDGAEEVFCKKHGVALERNILGEYEEDILEQEEQREKTLLGEAEKRFRTGIREREETEESIRKAEHDTHHLSEEIQDSRMICQDQERRLEEYEEELGQRRVILQYLELSEDHLFQKEKIEQELQRKMDGIDKMRRGLEREYGQMEQVCKSLEKGHLMELPADFEQYLAEQEITPMYGMDWLAGNGRRPEENRELVKRQPFLPYSIILTRRDMEKLQGQQPEVDTASPVPMLLREELEEGKDCRVDSAVCTLEHVRFYLHFRQELLSPEGRESLLALQRQQMEQKRHAIEIRKEEYASFFSKLEQIKGQAVTDSNYRQCRQRLEQEERRREENGKRLADLEEEKRRLYKRTRQLETELLAASENRQAIQGMLEDFQALAEQYRQYLRNRKAWEKLGETMDNLRRQIQTAKDKRQAIQGELVRVEREQLQQNDRKRLAMERLAAFQSFAGEDTAEKQILPQNEMLELESRYDALTRGASQEIQLLEEQLGRASGRYRQKEEELAKQMERHGCQESDVEAAEYSQDSLFELEEELAGKQKSRRQYESKIHGKDTRLAVIQSKIRDCYSKLEQTCGMQEPVGRDKITNLEFDGRSQTLLVRKKELEQKGERLERRVNTVENMIDSLCEYDEVAFEERLLEDRNPERMTEKELAEFKGVLLQEYRQCQEDMFAAREAVTAFLHDMARREAFAEEYFAKPLSVLLSLTGDARDLMSQLEITRDSYDSTMEKLAVDLSVVEKEKERVMGLISDYVKEIHDNLGRIDKNSTIAVRNRNVKMLTIRMPEWEDNEEVYRLRVQELLEDVTKQGLALLEENGNLEELVGIYINTNHLYDSVVGNGNVEIRLYKIEEQKEYPINWSDVAKNSGGEGFLSSFIILTSLLYSLRKDDTDIFADRNEGKVLVMDNPFAQTNAAHLLKPLMDMAKKTNTQLICLSGLGGDSIYNRFDNIYVLSLVAANLRTGTQYLQGEHLRGEEPDTMIAARFHVEQQTLLF